MIPSLDDRLDSVVRAIAEVILPALGADQPLAIEQAHLSLAQIGMVREQLDGAAAFERREAEAMLALAETLLSTAQGGEQTAAAAAALKAMRMDASMEGPLAVRRTTSSLGEGIEALIQASLHDGGESFRRASFQQVLEAGRRSAMADRRWNRSAGFEAQALDDEILGAIP